MPLVRAIFWMRGRILGTNAAAPYWSLGFVEVMLRMGWGVLAGEPNRWFVAGTVCQPWLADVVMSPVQPARFAWYSEPDQVMIIWTLEVETLWRGAKSIHGPEARSAPARSTSSATGKTSGADPRLPAHIRDLSASLHLMQRCHDLFFRTPFFRHLQPIVSRFERDFFQPKFR
jgi:hypothetical protein